MQIRVITLGCLSFLVAMVGSAGATPPGGAAWVQDMSRSDEFDGPSLNTEMWVSGPLWYAQTGLGWPFKPENGFVSDGNLHLRAVAGNPITAAAVHSKFLVKANNYVEVRAKLLPWAAHLLSAIWMSHGSDPGSDPSVEIDIQEVFNPTRITSNLHLWLNGKHVGDGVGHPVDVGVDVTADYHVYGFERRSPELLRFYFDGKMVWDAKPSRPSLYASQQRNLIFSLESHLGQPDVANLPAEALIDYVRIYNLVGGADGGGGGMDTSPGGGGSTATGGRSGSGGGAGGGSSTATGGRSGSGGGVGGGSSAAGGRSGAVGDAGAGAPRGGAGGRAGAGGAISTPGGSTNASTVDQTSSGCSCRLGHVPIRGKELGLAMALFLALSRPARKRRG